MQNVRGLTTDTVDLGAAGGSRGREGEPRRARACAFCVDFALAGESAMNDLQHSSATNVADAINVTAWACNLAAANKSRASCSECTWWQQPDLTQRAHLRRQLQRPRKSITPEPPTTAWFMCLHKPSSSREIAFFDYVRVAIMSARLNAPSLAPYVLYMHSPDEAYAHDTEDDGITGWLRSMGVRVLNSRLSFLPHMPPRKRPMERSTGICKMDIPIAASAHRAELAARGLDTERVLMTDADVLFADDFTFARWRRSRQLMTFAAGIEFFSTSLNSGVVYFNVTTFTAERARMLQYAVEKKFNFLVADQSWLQEWFDPALGKGRRARLMGWTRLDESVFNARPFAHPWRGHPKRPVPLPWTQPRLWHWHGYKPADVQCWLDAMAKGTWPLRGWRDTPGCELGRKARAAGAKEGGACLYQPIKGSGCRHLGRIRHTKCYLRTYTYLLSQHRRLLQMANSPGANSSVSG